MEPVGELEAMKAVATAMGDLNKESVRRVLAWAVSYFDVGAVGPSGSPLLGNDWIHGQSLGAGAPKRNQLGREADDVGELFATASPSTEAEKALLMAYWMQEMQGNQDLDAQRINTELKHLGHGVTNITRALEDLISRAPKLVIQIRKSGSTKQARKKYRLTHEGGKFAHAMLTGGSASSK